MPDKRKDTSLQSSTSNDHNSSGNRKKLKGDIEDAADNNLSFDPVHFIRSHSKNNDPADIQTQVDT